MKKFLSLLLSSIMLLSAMPAAMAAEENSDEVTVKQFHVAPTGRAAGDGSIEQPLDNLENARLAVASFKKNNSDTPVEVIFHEGTYYFDKAVNFTSADSGTVEGPITYKAAEGEKVYFKGSKVIDLSKIELVKDAETLAKLPTAARGKVGRIDLHEQGITDDQIAKMSVYFSTGNRNWKYEGTEIYMNDNLQTMARWPNGRDGYIPYESVVDMGSRNVGSGLGGTIKTSDYRLMKWENAKDAWISGFFSYDWLYERIKMGSVNAAQKEITMATGSVYGLTTAYSHRFAIINLIEELDIPGEYYIDYDEGMLYYYPERTLLNATLEITLNTTEIVTMNNVSNVNWEGITFAQTRGYAMSLVDKMENMTISHCTFENIGRIGIMQTTTLQSEVAKGTETQDQYRENGNINFHITNCAFYHIGWKGVEIYCGSRDANVPSGCSVTNNYVYDLGSADRRSYGLYICGVGVEIANNTIHQVPYAIYWLGCDFDIHHNETYDVMNNLADGGAIYTGRNFINRGNKVHHNYIHDTRTKAPYVHAAMSYGVYLDDMDSGTEVYQNIIEGVNDGIMINTGMSNNVHDNIVADFDENLTRMNTYKQGDKASYERMKTQGENALKLPGYDRFPDIKADLDSDLMTQPARNTIVNNLGYSGPKPNYGATLEGLNEINGNAVLGAEHFVDAENGDYRLKNTSPYAESTECLTEDFDMSTVGVQIDKFTENPVKCENFKLTYPRNGEVDIITKEITFTWQRPIGADRFRLVVARDSQLTDIVHDVITYETTHALSGFENGKSYYWKVYAANESVIETEQWESMGVPYLFTIARQYERNTDDLKAVVLTAKAKAETMVEGDQIGQYVAGTKQALLDKIAIAENMVEFGGYSEEEQNDIIHDIEDLMDNDIFINGGYVNLGDLIADDTGWSSNNMALCEVDAETKTLKMSAEGASHTYLGYMGVENYSRVLAVSFKLKVDFGEGSNKWFTMGMRGNSMVDASWNAGNDQYYMLVGDGAIEYQKNSGGSTTIVARYEDPDVKSNQWMDVDFGVVNLGNIGQLVILKINGKVAFQTVDSSESMVLKKGGLQFMTAIGTSAEIMAADKELDSFDELMDEYTLKMTEDFCKELEGYNNNIGGAFIRTGSNKAWYNGSLHDVAPATGEGENIMIPAELAATAFGVSSGSIQAVNGMVNLKNFAESIGKNAFLFNDQKLMFITNELIMHTNNYGSLFDRLSRSLDLYK